MKYSNFHITVNYNVDSEAHIGAMRTAVEEMVEAPYLWWWLRQYNGHSQQAFAVDNQNLVDRVRLRAAFEHGGKQNHGLHVHILVEIAHTTMVQIGKQGVIAVFEQFVPNMTPNVHSRFVKGEGEDKDFILHYITKEVSLAQVARWLILLARFRGTSRKLERTRSFRQRLVGTIRK